MRHARHPHGGGRRVPAAADALQRLLGRGAAAHRLPRQLDRRAHGAAAAGSRAAAAAGVAVGGGRVGGRPLPARGRARLGVCHQLAGHRHKRHRPSTTHLLHRVAAPVTYGCRHKRHRSLVAREGLATRPRPLPPPRAPPHTARGGERSAGGAPGGHRCRDQPALCPRDHLRRQRAAAALPPREPDRATATAAPEGRAAPAAPHAAAALARAVRVGHAGGQAHPRALRGRAQHVRRGLARPGACGLTYARGTPRLHAPLPAPPRPLPACRWATPSR